MEEYNKRSVENQDLNPRVSRKERLSLQRTSTISDSMTTSLNRAKRNAKYLYFFYLVILAIGIAISIYYTRTKKDFKINIPIKTNRFSFNRKIISSFINQKNRYGISIIIRNQSSNTWELKKILITSNKLSNNIEFKITKPIFPKKYQVYFIPLPKMINDLDDIDLRIG